jgi:oxalate decarboxylase
MEKTAGPHTTIRLDHSGHQDASIIGPTDLAREAQSPSGLAPPQTDHGALPTLKRCFADSYNRLEERGWARQATDPV